MDVQRAGLREWRTALEEWGLSRSVPEVEDLDHASVVETIVDEDRGVQNPSDSSAAGN